MIDSARKIRTGTTLLVAGYWLALFVATHLPRIPAALTMEGADKWEHLGTYATLACLLAFRNSLGQPVNWKCLLRIAVLVALYGVFDELTQIPVGRHADVEDWFADILGSAIGLSAFCAMRFVLLRCGRQWQPESPGRNSGSPTDQSES